MSRADLAPLVAAWMRGERLAPADAEAVRLALAAGYAESLARSFGGAHG